MLPIREYSIPILLSATALVGVQANGIADVKELTAFAALLALVFIIGTRQVAATREVKDALTRTEVALINNTAATKESGDAIKQFCVQMAEANKATLTNQGSLADRNLRETTQALSSLTDVVRDLQQDIAELLRHLGTHGDVQTRPKRDRGASG